MIKQKDIINLASKMQYYYNILFKRENFNLEYKNNIIYIYII